MIDITKYENNLGLPPLLLNLQTSKCPTSLKPLWFIPTFTVETNFSVPPQDDRHSFADVVEIQNAKKFVRLLLEKINLSRGQSLYLFVGGLRQYLGSVYISVTM